MKIPGLRRRKPVSLLKALVVDRHGSSATVFAFWVGHRGKGKVGNVSEGVNRDMQVGMGLGIGFNMKEKVGQALTKCWVIRLSEKVKMVRLGFQISLEMFSLSRCSCYPDVRQGRSDIVL
ncbi:hypothetical protein CHS0354_006536 [Potamilus streckersoni]|uniref:Uncharacterized protein n=1 Tax=Potamilus streckersoni TaxID=2493646 RepID=A0AAE0TCQ7_9BIVA|nr:hypothetical protein CHS0354_006536 [Potamilus streckersoni]